MPKPFRCRSRQVQEMPAALLCLVVGCTGAEQVPSESDAAIGSATEADAYTGVVSPSDDDGGAWSTGDAFVPVSPSDAGTASRDLDANGPTSMLDAMASVAPYSPCTLFSPVVDAEVPVTLVGPLAMDCASAAAGADAGPPTKGPIPPEAINPGGMGMNWQLVPDFIPVWGKSGEDIAGYVSKYELFCNICSGVHPVLDETLQYVVGHTVPGAGFVPIDEADASFR